MTGTGLQLADAPPAADHITDYDRRNLKVYARLLDAAAVEAEWEKVAGIVLGLDVLSNPDRARCVHHAHLQRARWMTDCGYRDLLTEAASR